jgi:hypothetical protein
MATGGRWRRCSTTSVVAVAARFDLLVQVAHGQRGADAVQPRREGAHALRALDQAFGLQFLQARLTVMRLTPNRRHQLGLRRHLRRRAPSGRRPGRPSGAA